MERAEALKPIREETHLPPQEKHERKTAVLTRKRPSQVESIADAVVIKDEDIFFLCQHNGQAPIQGNHGYGLYYHDCRFLKGFEIRLNGEEPQDLVATARRGFMAQLQLHNAAFTTRDGQYVDSESIGIRWQRVLDSEKIGLYDRLTLRNLSFEPVEFTLSFRFCAKFEDVYLVRGLLDKKLGKIHRPEWDEQGLRWIYEGTDRLYRGVRIAFKPLPSKRSGCIAHYRVKLPARRSKHIELVTLLAEAERQEQLFAKGTVKPRVTAVKAAQHQSTEEWLQGQTDFKSDSLFLDRIMNRSERDLRVLRTSLRGQHFYAAGVPWFVTLFGRDSILAARQTLVCDYRLAEQTLRLLAKHQATEFDDWRDEAPGKILHEHRDGELARTREIPHTPYYGSVDATPLFLMLIASHAHWCGSLKVFRELQENVERALEWIDRHGDSDGDGYIDYQSATGERLVNQGWKDSGDAMVNADGSLARPPIAPIEAQAYVYRAKLDIANLYERSGDASRAGELRRQAQELRERVNRDFWLEDKQFFAMALQRDGEPCAVISSNPGHALWTGIVDEQKAAVCIERLMAGDMYSGWGVRTLSTKEERYNPLSYHLGTVWPHDNSIIAAGFRQYGADAQAHRIFADLTAAATDFEDYRLPELFAGFARSAFGVPVRFPVACHPQAWAAGSVPFLLETLLGIGADAFEHRLRIVKPLLPDLVDHIELHGLRVGQGSADLRFERKGKHRHPEVEVLKTEGGLEVIVEEEG